MNIVLDTETSGLPRGCGFNKYPAYQNLDAYDTARIVSISWIVCKGHDVVQQAYYVVKPDNYVIGDESIRIHGITNEYAKENGVSIHDIVNEFKYWLDCCTGIVAHNVGFDKHVILSELHRYGYDDLALKLKEKHFICTMKKGKEFLNYHKNPKLEELYQALYNEPLENAHNAQADTYYCYRCFIKMFPVDKNIFFFRNKEVKLTSEQKTVVFEDFDKNMMVIACAGSGKTITSLCRIKHIIDSGIPENSIVLTTFTKDAADDMKNKLVDILGYTPNMTIGTIDSIAKNYTLKYCKSSMNDLKHVGEYGHDFLKLIKDQPSLISHVKYLFVDEFQDINDLQFNIIKEFYKQGCRIFGVGDDAQNIYTFRGSNISYILNFTKYFSSESEKACVYKLTSNFRSSSPIVEFANASIERNANQIPKQMVAANPEFLQEGIVWAKPIVQYFSSTTGQNNNLMTMIKELHEKGRVMLHDIAVLCPINQPLYQIEELLTKNGIKNVFLDGKSDVRTSRKNGHVCLSTIHKSKGLEWEHVFMVSMSDAVIPKMKNPTAVEEERRLFYVGSTRAKRSLYIYFAKAGGGSHVTRYVAELPSKVYSFPNASPDHFIKSDGDYISIKKSVTKLIELLDGEDFIKMKEQGISPLIDMNAIKRYKLYEGTTYKGIVKNDDLYIDFGIFIDAFITREAGKTFQITDCQYDKYTLQALSHITLDPSQYEIYKMYRTNFDENMRYIASMVNKNADNFSVWANGDQIKHALESNGSKVISSAHMPTLLTIINMLLFSSRKYNISIDKIPVFTERFLPDSFQTQMMESMKLAGNWDEDYKTVINALWDVSKSQLIVAEGRRRLLFKTITGSDILSDYETMMDNIKTHFLSFVRDRNQSIECRKDVRICEGIFGELDMLVGDTIIDYKTSTNDDINAMWFLQLLCYKVLCEKNADIEHRRKINHVGIFNPLKGWYYELDVSSWNKHNELIMYLLNKRKLFLMKMAI